MQTYQMTLVNYLNARQAIDLRDGERSVNFLPLFHTAGLNLYTLPILFAGGASKIIPGFDAPRITALIAEGAIDVFFAVPTVYAQLLAEPRFAEADLTRFRAWSCGGAALPDWIADAFRARGAVIQAGMGMTETGPTAFLQSRQNALARPGSIGRPQLLTDVRLVAEDRDAAAGEVGEIWFRGPGVTPGYWRDATATRAAFAEGGWLRTGDLAVRDEDGCFWFVGRIKQMVVSGGENVYPAEIEAALAQHPSIAEAAIAPIPCARWGEVGHAFLMLRPGAAAPTVAELESFCRARLAAYKLPRRWTILADFPRNAAGKVLKSALPTTAGSEA